MQFVLSFIVLAATIFTLISVITSDFPRYLPKVFWVLLVLFVPLIGMILWWAIGRDRPESVETVSFGDPRRYEATRVTAPSMTDDDIDAAVEREIAFHENEARIRRLEAEVRSRKTPPLTE